MMCGHWTSVVIPVMVLLLNRGHAYNERPVIGILTQETDPDSKPFYGDTYLPSNYVIYIQSAGARVVPIMVKKSMDYYQYMFKSINGILLPGGGVNLLTSEFAKTAEVFYQMALKAGNSGDYFPVWGTCQGFEMLMTLTAGINPMSKCPLFDKAIPLNFTKDARESRLFHNVPDDIYGFLATKDVTENFHSYGLAVKSYNTLHSLNQFYRVMSTNLDENGVEFVSSAEAYDYPVYALQWHPEKPMTTWNLHYHINHSPEALRVSQYMADFFVAEARKSTHKFATYEEELAASIENYSPVFHKDITFNNYYYFNYTDN